MRSLLLQYPCIAGNLLSSNEVVPVEQAGEGFEWDYAPPPTPYDLVRDSIVTKLSRLALHSILHPFIHSFNKLTVINREAVLNHWPCIITPNHSSHMDTMAVFSSLPVKFVNRLFAVAAKDYFFRNGIMAFAARLAANVIPLDRTGTEKEGLQLSNSKLKTGNSIIIFPEGTRSFTGEMGQFKKGAILLSREAKIPVIPTYIKGTLQSMPKSANSPRPVKITVVYGKPLRYWEPPLDILESLDAARHLEQHVRRLQQTLEEDKTR
jgi:1-acyl-sn-glycerol-3-phosphate acyltransferase